MPDTIKVSVEMDKALSEKLDNLAKNVARIPKRAYIERVLTEHVAKAEKVAK
jgi:predicted transcriptional regulator